MLLAIVRLDRTGLFPNQRVHFSSFDEIKIHLDLVGEILFKETISIGKVCVCVCVCVCMCVCD